MHGAEGRRESRHCDSQTRDLISPENGEKMPPTYSVYLFGLFFKQKTEFLCLDVLPVCDLPENKARVHSFLSGSLHSPASLSVFRDLLGNRTLPRT